MGRTALLAGRPRVPTGSEMESQRVVSSRECPPHCHYNRHRSYGAHQPM